MTGELGRHTTLTLNAIGMMSLTDPDGRNFSPNGNKARALVMLLAMSPNYVRSRQWLQSKLWSDRAATQASASLRNVLTEIRKAFGPHCDVLKANRQFVALDTELVRVNFTWPDGLSVDDVEPFEDIDVRDPEFEHLIRELRSRICEEYGNKTAAQRIAARSDPDPVNPDPVNIGSTGVTGSPGRRVLLIRHEIRGAPPASVAAHLLHDRIYAELGENSDLEVIADTGAGGPLSVPEHERSVVRLKILSVASDNECFLSCEVDRPSSGQKLWSDNIIAPVSLETLWDSARVMQLAQQTIEAVSNALYRDSGGFNADTCAWLMARQARDLIFRLDKKSLSEADRLFRRAYDLEPRGHFLAWRGFLRDIANFQHQDVSFLQDQVVSSDLALEALHQSPDNSTVLTISSQLEYINQGDAATSLRIVERSAEIDPNNALTWAVMSNALIAVGQCGKGYEAAQRALKLSAFNRNQYFFEHFACMAAVSLQNYSVAALHAATALMYRPEFVSVRRYDIALSLQRQDHAATRKSELAMRRQEPDFTPSRLLDPGYPVNTMRRLPLMDALSRFSDL